jgi:dTDP-4-dehydrorhamnose reductase
MNDALIGYSGFVGSTLLRQRSFAHLFRSTNIADVRNGLFDLVVCAGAPAQKWMANRDPDTDAATITRLIGHLEGMTCDRFILISTVDVFARPWAVDEDSPPEEGGLEPYGRNRLRLERFVAERFPRSLIIRLPGLVGPGLRKNVVYDLLNDNNLEAVDSRGVFQFYPMVNLWKDLETALAAGLNVLHLTAVPISVAEVAREGFGRELCQEVSPTAARYDLRSRHGPLFGVEGHYQYSRRETLLAIRAYAQSEPRKRDS